MVADFALFGGGGVKGFSQAKLELVKSANGGKHLFDAIVASCLSLCPTKGFPTESIACWCDILSRCVPPASEQPVVTFNGLLLHLRLISI